jgi:hypothetical protein
MACSGELKSLELVAFGVEIAEQADPQRVFGERNTDGSNRKKINLNHYGIDLPLTRHITTYEVSI